MFCVKKSGVFLIFFLFLTPGFAQSPYENERYYRQLLTHITNRYWQDKPLYLEEISWPQELAVGDHQVDMFDIWVHENYLTKSSRLAQQKVIQADRMIREESVSLITYQLNDGKEGVLVGKMGLTDVVVDQLPVLNEQGLLQLNGVVSWQYEQLEPWVYARVFNDHKKIQELRRGHVYSQKIELTMSSKGIWQLATVI